MVDMVIEELVKFPSLPEDDPGIAFTPVRRRALLIAIPDASPYISNNEIGSILSHYGTVNSVWKQIWGGFPNIFNGKRLVIIFPSGGTKLPPFVILQNKKNSLSYRGKPVFCNICMADTRLPDFPARSDTRTKATKTNQKIDQSTQRLRPLHKKNIQKTSTFHP